MEKASNNSVRVAIYLRVSTEEQAKEGYGIEYQREALQRHIEYRSDYFGWYTKKEWEFTDEGITGKHLNRGGFNRMMGLAKNKEIDVVLVWKIDRLSRNLTHLLEVFEILQSNDVSFSSLRENIDFTGPIGRLTFQIFGALAEFERETIKARTAEGKLAAARAGNYIGAGIPYGFTKVKSKGEKGQKLSPIPKEQEVVKMIFEWCVYKRLNYAQIARELTELGIPKGKHNHRSKKPEWNGGGVKTILTNPIYKGSKSYKIKDADGEVVEIEHKIRKTVDEVLFEAAQARAMELSGEKSQRGGGNNKYLLGHKITDIETGRSFVGYPREKGGFGYRRKGFIDPDGKKYKNLEMPAEAIDKFVWDEILLLLDKPDVFYRKYQEQNVSLQEIKRLVKEKQNLTDNIEDMEEAIISAEDAYYRGKTSEERKDENIRRYEQKIDRSKKRLGETETTLFRLTQAQMAKSIIKDYASQFEQDLSKLTFEQKRILVDTLVDRVYVTETDNQIQVKVNFRFAQPIAKDEVVVVEPENSLKKPKDGKKDAKSAINGG
ncbi:MAG: recombinase family protein [Patescibacteria group bacterium]|nr:recombinase family protein [Patescibacteria group bacterium]